MNLVAECEGAGPADKPVEILVEFYKEGIASYKISRAFHVKLHDIFAYHFRSDFDPCSFSQPKLRTPNFAQQTSRGKLHAPDFARQIFARELRTSMSQLQTSAKS